MPTDAATQEQQRTGWTAERFGAFWSDPNPAYTAAALTDDVVGHWPGLEEPVRGKEDYTRCIADLVQALPGMYLEVGEHAYNGEFAFVRWIMHATGALGPFELGGIDRVRLRDGKVAENVIAFDTAAFERRAGMKVPWT
jgi:hypothetical protein